MADIGILGAGPAGLFAALELQRRGHRCMVFEAQPHPGGMAASIEVAGQRVDLGSHRLHHATPPDLLDEIRGWLGDDLQTRQRHGRIHLQGRWIGFPLRAGDMIRNLPPGFTARAVSDTLLAPTRRRTPTSFDDAIRRRFGPAVADDFYGPYAEKLYGCPPGELDVELAERRVSAGGPADIARRVLRAARPAGRTFLYPRRGYGQIVDALAATACEADVDLRLDTTVRGIERHDAHLTVDTGDRTSAVDLVLSSITPAGLARLLPDVPEQVEVALGQIRTRAMVLVYLVVDRARYTAFDAHYVPDLRCATARLSEPKNYRDGDDPEDRTVLCAEIPCWLDDPTWMATDARLGDQVMADLEILGLPRPTLRSVHTVRLPSVYPVLEQQSRSAREQVSEWAAGLDRVISFGRQGLGVADNLHHVLAMGRAVARAVGDDGAFDHGAWRESLAVFAQHVVED